MLKALLYLIVAVLMLCVVMSGIRTVLEFAVPSLRENGRAAGIAGLASLVVFFVLMNRIDSYLKARKTAEPPRGFDVVVPSPPPDRTPVDEPPSANG